MIDKNPGNMIILPTICSNTMKNSKSITFMYVPLYILSLNDIKLCMKKHSYFTNYQISNHAYTRLYTHICICV